MDKSFKDQISEEDKKPEYKIEIELKEQNSENTKVRNQITSNNDFSTLSNNPLSKNANITSNSLDKKDEISHLQNNTNAYLFNEASNFAPLGGNLTNLFYDNENSMRIFQNNNYNSNIFNNDNLFHSNNFNSLFMKNNNNEDSMMVNKKNFFSNNEKMRSNLYPYSYYNNTNLADKERTNQKFSMPELISSANLNKSKINSSNSLIDLNKSNKKSEGLRIDENSFKTDSNAINTEIQLMKKKTKRSKKADSDIINKNMVFNHNQQLSNQNLLEEGGLNLKDSDKKANKELELSESKTNSNSKNNKKSSNGKNNSANEKAQNKPIRRTGPIKLDELLDETEKNISYSTNTKNLNKTASSNGNSFFHNFENFNNTNISNGNNNINNNYLNLNINNNNNTTNTSAKEKKSKSVKNLSTNANCNNTSSVYNNSNKKSWIINQNNYFNNYNSAASNARFVNPFANIDIPDPSGFMGKSAKGACAPNTVGFINPHFWQLNQLGTAGFINPAYMQMHKIPMMYVPANYVFGNYDLNAKCDFPPSVGIFPANPLLADPLIMNNTGYYSGENSFVNRNNNSNVNNVLSGIDSTYEQHLQPDEMGLPNNNYVLNPEFDFSGVDKKGRGRNKNDKQ